jgi:glutathione S-transferase
LPGAEKHFPMLEKLVTQSGSGFILQSGISYADFLIASYLAEMVKRVEGEYLAKYSKLMDYMDRVHGVPQLRQYMMSRQQKK